MNKVFLIVVTVIIVIGTAVMVWIVPVPVGAPDSIAPTVTVPQQFDTTSGQEMRPRWDAREDQGNDAAND